MTGSTHKPAETLSSDQIVDLFQRLPGDKAFKTLVPAVARKPEFSAQLNPNTVLFAASALKTFVLCEALRQADSPDVDRVLQEKMLRLDSSVWALGSPTFNSPAQTFASSAGDLVTYYVRALQGDFFTHRETLNEFRRILTLCDFIYLVPLPLGASAYAKSGNVDAPDFHVRSLAGGMFAGGRWAYFAFIVNCYAPSEEDPETIQTFFDAINRTLGSMMLRLTGDGQDG